jgi:ABC-2 type transport system ATP-binding protein
MPVLVETQRLAKFYGKNHILEEISIKIDEGSIVGLLGPNGAGKSTLLKCLLGLIPYEGQCRILDRDPRRHRARLMQEVGYVPDQSCLPLWLTVERLLQLVADLHPRFSMERARHFLEGTEIQDSQKLSQLSKGTRVQLHLALTLAIDSHLLVLDEPTLGLDITRRAIFWKQVLSDYCDGKRTLIIATHLMQEVEHLLTHLVLIDRGRIILDQPFETAMDRYCRVLPRPGQEAALRALSPASEEQILGQPVFLFDGRPKSELERYGTLHRASLAEIFETATRRRAS